MTLLFAYLSLALSAFLSSTLLPGTSEVTLLAVLAQWPKSWIGLLVTASLANTTGATVNWALGRWALAFQDKRWFPVSTMQIEKASRLYNRFGLVSLLLAWVPLVGDPLTFVAGLLRVRLLPFVVLVGLGKAARYAALAAGFLNL